MDYLKVSSKSSPASVAGAIAGWVGYQKLYLVLCIPVIVSTLLFVWDQRAYRLHTGLYRNSGQK